MYVHNNI